MNMTQTTKLDRFLRDGDYLGLIEAISGLPEAERDYETLIPYCETYLRCEVFPHNLSDRLKTEVQGDRVRIPQWELTITPHIRTLTANTIVVDLFLDSPFWDGSLYECCSGVGSDIRQAMGSALGSFFFSFLDGFDRMREGRDPITVETSFAGKPHRFEVYLSNITGMGAAPMDEHTDVATYWEALKDGITKRLGNQSFLLVKIFGSKFNGEITGECRVGDVASEELGGVVSELVKPWKIGQFYSHKQFILIRQAGETLEPYPYSGEEGQLRFRQAIVTAARMFHESETEELYESYPIRLAQAIGDETLAEECVSFLPELCAQNAYSDVSYTETVEIAAGDAPAVTCYKSQLADYWPMWNVLWSALRDGTFGQEANTIYREYISVSATYNVLQQMEEKGSSLSGGQLSTLLFRMGTDFVLR